MPMPPLKKQPATTVYPTWKLAESTARPFWKPVAVARPWNPSRHFAAASLRWTLCCATKVWHHDDPGPDNAITRLNEEEDPHETPHHCNSAGRRGAARF